MGCLYQIEFPNGKKYIGVSRRSALKRCSEHFKNAESGANNILYSAIRKFGRSRCLVKTMLIADDFEYLLGIEKKAILKFGSKYPYGYNSTSGGDGVKELPKEIKAKQIFNLKKSWNNESRRKAVSDARKMDWKNSEYRENISKKIRKKMLELCKDPEHIKKMSERSKNKWKDSKYRKKIIASKKDIYKSPEHRDKISKGLKEKWKDPKFRKRMCESQQKRWGRTTNAIQ